MGAAGRLRFRLLLALAIIVPLGFVTKFYDGPVAFWVRAHAGGTIYVIFWCLFAQVLWPRRSAWHIAAMVLLLTCLLECLQLWQPPFLQMIRSSFLGHALIGSKFSWWDFPHYLFGALLAVGLTCLLSFGRDNGKRAA